MSVAVETKDEAVSALMDSLMREGMPAEACVIYRGRNVVAAVGDRCIKAFGIPGVIKGYIYGLFRKPKAERAFLNAQKLISLGINTPEPLAYGVERHGGRLGASYYVCRMLHGYSELRGIEKRPDFDALADALAAFMHELHRKGVYFKDFTQGNVLFRPSDDGYEFVLVDINRMTFGVTDRNKLYKNFGSTLDTEAGQRTLARCYSRLTGDPQLADRLMDIYRRKQAALWRHRRLKDFLKRPGILR